MLLYLFTVRITALSLTHLFNSRHISAAFTGLLFTLLAWASGYAVHEQQLGVWVFWIKYFSPQYWMSHPINQGEFGPVDVLRYYFPSIIELFIQSRPVTNWFSFYFRCTGNPVITENSIIKQVPCGLPSGEEVIRYFGFLTKFSDSEFFVYSPFLVTATFYVFFQLLAFICFIMKRQVTKMSRTRKNKM